MAVAFQFLKHRPLGGDLDACDRVFDRFEVFAQLFVAQRSLDGQSSLAGGRNVFAERAERYPQITTADLASADPELVLLCSEPFPFEEGHADELAKATGIDRARFRLADGEYLSWHGSRTPEGIDYAERLILSART